MRLYFFRHGEAEDGINRSDHDRQLTTNGSARVKTAAQVLAKLGVKPAHIYSSPRVRAKQTADLLSAALGVPVEERNEVNFPMFGVGALAGLIHALDEDAEIILVGHEPTFSDTLHDITGGAVEMKKGGCARIDIMSHAPLRGTLVWLITPKVFDVLGE